ncbi:SNF2 family DNA-dependent ATPase [Reticulomyxa filosa]|uniref:SNF2 family DNA-dependent ATPase n=1 Tax=Reticulomyxa filosa TaxID=46433 RepID=X6LXH7_RETFI|nr:SNF2 family DNA-dependent ATPase [Reticulomyxa filosa]|eukprot:ETO05400.1 SNF2 family DNA-dependent ATPase [Reticulomyxa filosa]
MRHVKSKKFDGVDIVSLPMKHEQIIKVEFTKEQKGWYDKLYQVAVNRYQCSKSKPNHNIQSAYFMLSHVRRVCSACCFPISLIHQLLTEFQLPSCLNVFCTIYGLTNNTVKNGVFEVSSAIAFNQPSTEGDMEECPICSGVMEDPFITPCRHLFCCKCICKWIHEKKSCPLCRSEIKGEDKLKKHVRQQKKEEVDEKREDEKKEEKSNAIVFDGKVKVLMKQLNKLREEKPTDKILIFTMFSECASWLTQELQKNHFNYQTLHSGMTIRKRQEALKSFQHDPNVNVFVLTIRTGAIGVCFLFFFPPFKKTKQKLLQFTI